MRDADVFGNLLRYFQNGGFHAETPYPDLGTVNVKL